MLLEFHSFQVRTQFVGLFVCLSFSKKKTNKQLCPNKVKNAYKLKYSNW